MPPTDTPEARAYIRKQIRVETECLANLAHALDYIDHDAARLIHEARAKLAEAHRLLNPRAPEAV